MGERNPSDSKEQRLGQLDPCTGTFRSPDLLRLRMRVIMRCDKRSFPADIGIIDSLVGIEDESTARI
jgi:hypothetical protein